MLFVSEFDLKVENFLDNASIMTEELVTRHFPVEKFSKFDGISLV